MKYYESVFFSYTTTDVQNKYIEEKEHIFS